MLTEKLNLGNIFALLGVVSILSLFVVVPYTVGYFAFYDVSLMGFFTLNDFYLFGAFPILIINVGAIAMVAVGYMHLRFTGIRERHWLASLKLMVRAFAVVAVVGVLFVPVGLIVETAITCVILLLVAYVQKGGNNLVASCFGIFLCVELSLFIWGSMVALDRYNSTAEISIASKDGTEVGRRIFLGANAILLVDSKGVMKLRRMDNGTTVTLAKAKERYALGCLRVKLLDELRHAAHIDCFLY